MRSVRLADLIQLSMEGEVSHAAIYRELGVLQGKMDSLILSRAKEEQDRADMFRRVGALESRMAQVIIIAVITGLVLPVAIGWFGDFMRTSPPAQIERRQ